MFVLFELLHAQASRLCLKLHEPQTQRRKGAKERKNNVVIPSEARVRSADEGGVEESYKGLAGRGAVAPASDRLYSQASRLCRWMKKPR
jgi:hypothetical protein